MPPTKLNIYKQNQKVNKEDIVQLFYEVKLSGRPMKKELPYVVGVIADLSGKPKPDAQNLEKKEFLEIDAMTFDKVLKGVSPQLDFTVPNKLQQEGKDELLKVQLQFSTIEDFEPEQVVTQVPSLQFLLQIRQDLKELLAKSSSNPKLRKQLEDMVKDKKLLEDLGREASTVPPKS